MELYTFTLVDAQYERQGRKVVCTRAAITVSLWDTSYTRASNRFARYCA